MKRSPTPPLIGKSPSFRRVVDTLERVAPSDASVLVLGESGTGKATVARVLHSASPRRDNPFVSLDCASLPPRLVTSELFGHEAGAFTGATAARVGRIETAEDGTVFLDHVECLAPAVQSMLLRTIDSGEICRLGSTRPRRIDFRVVASAASDLRERVASGRFRDDLFWRLNVVELPLPPLRERREDVLPLAKSFLSDIRQRGDGRAERVSDSVATAFEAHDWPGNLRELRNVCEAAAVRAGDSVVRAEDLPAELRRQPPPEDESPTDISPPDAPFVPTPPDGPREAGGFRERVHDFQRRLVLSSLKRHFWDLQRTATELALTRHQLRYLLKKLDLR